MHILARVSLDFIGGHSHFGFTFALGLATFILGTLLRRLHAQRSAGGDRMPKADARLHLKSSIASLRAGEESAVPVDDRNQPSLISQRS